MRSLLSSLALLPALALAQPDASSFLPASPACRRRPRRRAFPPTVMSASPAACRPTSVCSTCSTRSRSSPPRCGTTWPVWWTSSGSAMARRCSPSTTSCSTRWPRATAWTSTRWWRWGVESDYGRIFGKRPLLTSLSTLSCYGRRQSFFQGEFLATLKLLQAGDIRDAGITGSWAGLGHTQFMPSTYARIAVDFDGDGRRDLVGSVPDALGSTANYLKKAGWRTGQPGL